MYQEYIIIYIIVYIQWRLYTFSYKAYGYVIMLAKG